MRRAWVLSTFLAVAVAPLGASATPQFPSGIQSHLGLSYTPPCSICHVNGQTGVGTANTPFALAMKANGLVPNDDASLVKALDALESAKVDSDGDTVPDIEELIAGTDPNTKGGTLGGDAPAYGCGAQIAAGPSAAEPLLIAVAVALLVRAARRRSRGA